MWVQEKVSSQDYNNNKTWLVWFPQIVHGAAWYQQKVRPPPMRNWPEPTSTQRWKNSSVTPSSPSLNASSLTLHLNRWQQGPTTTLTAWPPAHRLSQASAALLLHRPNLRMSVGSWTWRCPRRTDLVRKFSPWIPQPCVACIVPEWLFSFSHSKQQPFISTWLHSELVDLFI